MQRRTGLVARVLATACLLATAPAAAAEHVVQVVTDYQNARMYFSPKLLTIQPGDTVTWVNQVKEQHNIVTFPDGYPKGAAAIVSPYLEEAGARWSVTLTVPGTYQYHCIPHLPMGMNGSIIVDRPSLDREFHEPSKAEVAAYRERMLEFFDKEDFQYRTRRQRAND